MIEKVWKSKCYEAAPTHILGIRVQRIDVCIFWEDKCNITNLKPMTFCPIIELGHIIPEYQL